MEKNDPHMGFFSETPTDSYPPIGGGPLGAFFVQGGLAARARLDPPPILKQKPVHNSKDRWGFRVREKAAGKPCYA